MSHPTIKPVAVIILHETKHKQPITIQHEIFSALKISGIERIALLTLCPPKVVSMAESSFVPYPGSVMRESIGPIQEELKLAQYLLVNDYSDMLNRAVSSSEYYEDIISALKQNIDDTGHPYRYVIFDERFVSNIDEEESIVHTDLDLAVAAKALRLRVVCENYLYHLQQPKADADINLTHEKQQVVLDLLKLAKNSTADSLQMFGQLLRDQRTTLEARRDSTTMIFLKVLLSFFTLGIAVACGLWQKEGEKVVDELSCTFSR